MRDVKITIKSTQIYDKERETTELITLGTYNVENGVYTISYNDSEATGFEGCVTTLTVDGEKVSMERTGKTSSGLIIERGKKHHCVYGTLFGDLMVGVNTKKVLYDLNENGGEMFLSYTIDVNSAYMSDNKMFIKIEETKSETEPS